MATRYDQKTKDEVVAYVQKYNEANGRGGQSAALKKWKLNPITIKSWLEKAGFDTPGTAGKKKRKAGRPAGSVTKSVAPAEVAASTSRKSTEGVSETLQRMLAIREQITSLETEFAKLRNKL